jgi:hypothetical protein
LAGQLGDLLVLRLHLGHQNGLGSVRQERRREHLLARRDRLLVDGKFQVFLA